MDERRCSVDRVEDPPETCIWRTRFALLLAEDRVIGKRPLDQLAEQPFRAAVRDRDRRQIRLQVRDDRRLEVLERDLPGLPRRVDGELHQAPRRFGRAHDAPYLRMNTRRGDVGPDWSPTERNRMSPTGRYCSMSPDAMHRVTVPYGPSNPPTNSVVSGWSPT